MEPTVTLGICAKNAETFIKRLFNVILNQDFPHKNMEIIFVDDGSEDRTLSFIKDFISKIDIDARVFHQEWKGVGAARDVIVNNARGKYILWIDTDQMLSNDYVRIHVNFMEQNKDTGICYGTLKIPKTNSALYLVLVNKHFQRENQLTIGTGATTYRVKAIIQVGGFDDTLKGYGEDADARLRILKAGWSMRKAGGTFDETHGNMTTWKDLWDKYFRQGFHGFDTFKKEGWITKLPRMSPMAGCVAGVLKINRAYRVFHDKIVFMLPIHVFIQNSAWCLGFIKNQFFSE